MPRKKSSRSKFNKLSPESICSIPENTRTVEIKMIRLLFILLLLTIFSCSICSATAEAVVPNNSFEIAHPYKYMLADGWHMDQYGSEWQRQSKDIANTYTNGTGIEGDWVACSTFNNTKLDGFNWMYAGNFEPAAMYTITAQAAGIGNKGLSNELYFILDGQTTKFDIPGNGMWRTYTAYAIKTKLTSPLWVGCYNTEDTAIFLDNVRVCIPEPGSMFLLLSGCVLSAAKRYLSVW